jgi:hypothetical protein
LATSTPLPLGNAYWLEISILMLCLCRTCDVFSHQKIIEAENMKVSIHWDYENVPQKEIAKNLLLFAKNCGELKTSNIYTNSELPSNLKQDFQQLGYNCISVNLSGKKNVADFKLSVEVGGDRSDIIIIVSGDYYCQILLNKLHEQGKKGIIFAREKSECKILKNLADEFYFLKRLPDLVANKNQRKTTNLQSQITWENAVNCLIENLKVAAKQGKPTTLPYMGKQIRQSLRLPKNQKFVVCKNNGSKITKLSTFVKELDGLGKVTLEGDRLLLPGK